MANKGFLGYYLLVLVIVPIILIILPFFFNKFNFAVPVFIVIVPFWLYFIYDSTKTIYVHFKRKRILLKFCQYLDTIKNVKIILTDQTFELNADSKTDLIKWDAFKGIEVSESYLSLIGPNDLNYFFPKNDMLESEFNDFIQFAKERIKIELLD